MRKEEFQKDLDEAIDFLTKNTKPIHVLSDDENKRAMAMLNRTLRMVKMFLAMQDIKEVAHPTEKPLKDPLFGKMGDLVSIRPCGEEYENKTYLGFLIGEMALGSSLSISEDKIQCEFSSHNPAIFVPALRKVIYGCESWWGKIESEEDFKKITDEDIENVWYVKLYREMNKENIKTDKK